MVPMVVGSLSQRALIQPKRAAMEIRVLRSWREVMNLRPLVSLASVTSDSDQREYRQRPEISRHLQQANCTMWLTTRASEEVAVVYIAP
jgi:hypothetical protein